MKSPPLAFVGSSTLLPLPKCLGEAVAALNPQTKLIVSPADPKCWKVEGDRVQVYHAWLKVLIGDPYALQVFKMLCLNSGGKYWRCERGLLTVSTEPFMPLTLEFPETIYLKLKMLGDWYHLSPEEVVNGCVQTILNQIGKLPYEMR